jgi:NAD(P)-dependent dehydrogenase (short-subunit alcohol dehydrogenase family)
VRLQGKAAIVTGAASGIGKRIAERYAEEGARVAAVDRKATGVEDTVKCIRQSGGQALAETVDITEPAQVQRMVTRVVEQYGSIDILCHSAGQDQPITRIVEMDVALWDRIMTVNARGAFLCSRYVLPVMLAARRGAIVIIASDLGYVVVPGLGAYCSSKGAVLQLTRVLAAENGPFGIRVNAICPTMVDTPMAQRTLDTHPNPQEWLDEIKAGVPLRRIGTVQDVADAALFLASDEAAYITGVSLPVDGGRTVL